MAAAPALGKDCFEGNSRFRSSRFVAQQSYCVVSAATRPKVCRVSLIDRLWYQFDVFLARRLAFGILPDPGFPTASVRHIAARKGNAGHIGVPYRDLPARLGQDAHGGSGNIAIENIAFEEFAGFKGNGDVAPVIERLL